MKKTIVEIYCDICGMPIKNGVYRHRLDVKTFDTPDSENSSPSKNWELCQNCFRVVEFHLQLRKKEMILMQKKLNKLLDIKKKNL